jgi:hypothetical protein
VHASKLTEKRCVPCEASHDALDKMGLAMVMDQGEAEKLRAQVRCMAAQSTNCSSYRMVHRLVC